MKKYFSALILSGFIACALGGCGIKPSGVSPPEGAKEPGFPRTYPNAQYDPHPAVPPSPVN